MANEVGADVVDALDSARLYLAYSLGRDGKRDLWNWADEDEDLAIIPDGFVPQLKLELVRIRLRYPDLHQMEGEQFQDTMSDVIAAA